MDEVAFDAMYAASFTRLVGQIYAMCGSLPEAQDCVQEAFGRAWARRGTLRREDNPEAWLRTTAYRLAVSRWRRHRKDARAADRSLARPGAPVPGVERVALHRALQQLPPEQRRAIVLHHLCDLPVLEVARETGAPESTVKARLRRGRAALALLLDDREESDHVR